MKVLFVDCCLRPAQISRTFKVCTEFIQEYKRRNPGHRISTTTLKNENLLPLFYEHVQDRDALIAGAKWENETFRHARGFAEADKIIIGAPYWDLSFPALLKIYFENIFVGNLTYHYGETGLAGLCKAEKLLYITTSGGFIGENDFGTDYLKGVCSMFGIAGFQGFKVEGLDVQELDTGEILRSALESVKEIAKQW